ncbi:octopamine receptor 1 isoform X1 [Tribolium castaneum]|uniref:octopamine receptor 1 isoform X1 n=1 Tax=Tribolium castaneum TaxID=7070 RepID=UPI00077DA285|nr:PREDICTED: octopamine receptor 1 isoform X1 [Tribolium castaneum]|eukprot:XP_015833052.1 PREDICTED: octopamine receptor 1 isoform X1 [Tribolium castaneum]
MTSNNSSETFVYPGSALWISVYSLIFSVIISGNLLTIFAIALNRRLSSVTANKFIYSLAITDLLVGLYIPYHVCFYIYKETLDGQLPCLIMSIVPLFACSHSICKLLTIAADRYIAILYPLHYNKYMSNRMVWTLILSGRVFSSAISTVPIFWNNWETELKCDIFKFLPQVYFNYILTPLFGIIWITMLLVYVKIWKEARQHARRIRRVARVPKDINDSKSFQVVMLTLGCFSICWMPYFIVTTYFRISGSSSQFSLLYEIAFTLAVCNSGMNPVIYAWKNSNFREAFWCLLTCHSPNNSTKKTNYITNHVPSSKKSSIGGHDNVVAQTEIEIESPTPKDYDEHECSVSTEMTTVNTSTWS